MVASAVLRGGLVGLVPLGVWWLVGKRRRTELFQQARKLRLFEVGLALALAAVLWWEPWSGGGPTVAEGQEWKSLAEFLGPEVPLPDEVADLQVLGDVTTEQTRRLIESAISTYDQSKTFYTAAAEQAAGLDLRVPDEDETVVLLIADRHDNIGMDKVARAVGDAGGATVGLRRGRRHLGRPDVGGVQPRLGHHGVRGLRPLRGGRQPRPRHVRAHLPRRARLDDARRHDADRSRRRPPPRHRRPAVQRAGQLA